MCEHIFQYLYVSHVVELENKDTSILNLWPVICNLSLILFLHRSTKTSSLGFRVNMSTLSDIYEVLLYLASID